MSGAFVPSRETTGRSLLPRVYAVAFRSKGDRQFLQATSHQPAPPAQGARWTERIAAKHYLQVTDS